jgi:hypothetical protein
VIKLMPRPRPPHLRLEKTRHGRRVWYFRLGNGPRIRINREYGTPEFQAAYHAALRGEQSGLRPVGRAGSLAWLISRYREVDAWRSLSQATRRQRENIFKEVIRTAGTSPYCEITKATIAAGRDRRAGTPAQARHFLQAMRGLFGWAAETELLNRNPTLGVKDPRRARPRASQSGPRTTLSDTATSGRSAPRSASGSTYCSIQACAAATL